MLLFTHKPKHLVTLVIFVFSLGYLKRANEMERITKENQVKHSTAIVVSPLGTIEKSDREVALINFYVHHSLGAKLLGCFLEVKARIAIWQVSLYNSSVIGVLQTQRNLQFSEAQSSRYFCWGSLLQRILKRIQGVRPQYSTQAMDSDFVAHKTRAKSISIFPPIEVSL